MVFSSIFFLFFFLPLVLILYFSVGTKLRNLVLLVASLVFYAWGEFGYVLLMLFSICMNWIFGLLIDGAKETPKKCKLFLAAGIALNLIPLAFFKYGNFFFDNVSRLGFDYFSQTLGAEKIHLPIGISFFTFQKISYLVDVYRRSVAPARSIVNYLLYVVSFPQLIAGPIVRYRDVSQQIEERVHDLKSIHDGAYRFCVGLAKKVLIADTMGAVASNVFSLSEAQLSTPYAWLGIICYAYQIYFDFSGYSDMAIGLGKLMGFHFLENFDRPYTSQNFSDFWRRWHISLSRWMRDYLYIPLGGNRVDGLRRYANLWIVFLISGLWHGASTNFIVWGAFHGFFLTLDKLFWIDFSKRFGRVFNTGLTFILVCVGWVFFRCETFGEALFYLDRMFSVAQYWTVSEYMVPALVIHNAGVFIFVLASLLCFVPSWPRLPEILNRRQENASEIPLTLFRFSTSAICLLLSVLALATSNFAPFIYFRF